MRTLVTLCLVSAAAFNVCAGGVLQDKQSVIKEIENKLKEVVTAKQNLLKLIDAERKGVVPTTETELLKHIQTKTNETLIFVQCEATAAIRTAIVKAKPINVIKCIRGNTVYASNNARELDREQSKLVREVKTDKLSKIDLDEFSINAIVTGVTELVAQAKEKINGGGHVIETVKKEALANCESALLLLSEVEINIHDPVLSKEYTTLKHDTDRKFREFKDSVRKMFENCVKSNDTMC